MHLPVAATHTLALAHTHADKGIKTNYLPSSTVTLKAVEMPQETRFDGSATSKPQGKYNGEYNYNFM